MAGLNDQLADLIASKSSETDLVFIHSDLMKASYFVERTGTREELLQRHIHNVDQLCGGCAIWFPTFNYDFPKGHEYNVEETESQVGPLSEFFRTQMAHWRSPEPVFSVAGTGDDFGLAKVRREITAFDDTSFLARLYDKNALLLFYGAGFPTATALHLAESMAGGPLYRYDKVFNGSIKVEGRVTDMTYTYHVRPWQMRLNYDWAKIIADVEKKEILRPIRIKATTLAAVALMRPLVDFWVDQLKHDPLYFLNEESLVWAKPKLDELQRRFVLSDFE